jgi:hypothetical protein
MKTLFRVAGTSFVLLLAVQAAEAQTLRGSPASVQRQYRVAQDHSFTFLRSSQQVRRFVDLGYLVHLPGNENYTLARVSHPYARPEVKLFVERLSAQYRAACGEQLVVTSLTRPTNGQPANASSRSVHPAGMAVDLRVSQQARCRSWLERTLLSLERQGVVNATREYRPPHYHVAVYPRQYASYVARLGDRPATGRAAPGRAAPAETVRLADATTYRVRRGDSLWSIARRHGLSVDTLKEANQLSGPRIYAGQTLQIPVSAP